jgi:hypothetical protein
MRIGHAASPARRGDNFTCGLEFGISLGPDRGSAASKKVGRRDVFDGAVETHGVVILDEAGDESTCLIERIGL